MVLFERAFFTNTDTIATSRALIVFAMGLPAFVCVKIFQVMFFSRENTRSPMIFAGFTVLTNIFISLALFQYLGYLGIAIGTTISSWINLILLCQESAAKKYFIYSFYTAIVNVQKDAKDLYLSIFIILSALVIPRWNFFLEGWDENPLYIADVTKKYFLSLLVIFLSFLIASRFFPKQVENRLPFITLKYTVFLFIFLSVFNWNAVVADWVEDTVFYIPHITKIFVVLVLVSSVLVRGLFKPVSNKVKLNYLLPFRWLFIGTIGLILDIVKAPGYIIGSLISKFR